MAEGDNNLGSLGFNITASGADEAAKQVEKVAKSLEDAAKAAEQANQKIRLEDPLAHWDKTNLRDAAAMEQQAAGAVQNHAKVAAGAAAAGAAASKAAEGLKSFGRAAVAAGTQATGATGPIGGMARGLLNILPLPAKIAVGVVAAAVALDRWLNNSKKVEESRLAQSIEDIKKKFDDLRDSVNKFDIDSWYGPSEFDKLEEQRDAALKELVKNTDSTAKEGEAIWKQYYEKVAAYEDFNNKQSARRAFIERGQSDVIVGRMNKAAAEKSAKELERIKEESRVKIAQAEQDAKDKAADAERERLASDRERLAIAKEHESVLRRQADVVNEMIATQTNFARQFNESNLNIEQLQAINSTITRIENALQRLSR